MIDAISRLGANILRWGRRGTGHLPGEAQRLRLQAGDDADGALVAADALEELGYNQLAMDLRRFAAGVRERVSCQALAERIRDPKAADLCSTVDRMPATAYAMRQLEWRLRLSLARAREGLVAEDVRHLVTFRVDRSSLGCSRGRSPESWAWVVRSYGDQSDFYLPDGAMPWAQGRQRPNFVHGPAHAIYVEFDVDAPDTATAVLSACDATGLRARACL